MVKTKRNCAEETLGASVNNNVGDGIMDVMRTNYFRDSTSGGLLQMNSVCDGMKKGCGSFNTKPELQMKSATGDNSEMGSNGEKRNENEYTVMNNEPLGFHVKAIGLNLEYASQRCILVKDKRRIKEIDLQKPCKMAIAVLLFLYVVGEQMIGLYSNLMPEPNLKGNASTATAASAVATSSECWSWMLSKLRSNVWAKNRNDGYAPPLIAEPELLSGCHFSYLATKNAFMSAVRDSRVPLSKYWRDWIYACREKIAGMR